MSNIWSIEFVNKVAEKEIRELTPDLQADFLHISELLIEFGPNNVGMPHTKSLKGKLWELRLRGKDNIARSIYCIECKQRIVILYTFIKKTQKTPRNSLEIASKRLKEVRYE